MPVPPTYVLKFKGSGQAQVYPLLNGTTLGSQVGSDFGTLETAYQPRIQNRVIEAFGKVFALQGGDICEKDEGGVGSWGVVYTPLGNNGLTFLSTSGWFMVHPGGRPCLATMLIQQSFIHPYVCYTFDGVNWTVVIPTTSYSGSTPGDAISYRDSIFWGVSGGAAAGGAGEFNLQTLGYTPHNYGLANCRDRAFCVADNVLFSINPSATNGSWYLYRLSGSTFNTVLYLGAASREETNSGSICFADGRDVICFFSIQQGGGSILGTMAQRVVDAATSPSRVEITDPVIPAAQRYVSPGSAKYCYEVLVDNNTSPGVPPTIYIWYQPGYQMYTPSAGSRTCYQFQYRSITHGAVTGGPFVAGEVVLGSSSGATGVVHTVGTGKLHLADVSSTLFTSGELLTGQTSNAEATSSGVLEDEPMLLIGGSISVDYAISAQIHDSIGPFIPTYPGARIELGITGVQLTHGSVTSGPFELGETVTDQSNGATGTIFIDNIGALVVFLTSPSQQFGTNTILGSSSGASAVVSLVTTDVTIPQHEVIGGRKHYFRVYGDPATYTATLYISFEERAPWQKQTILSVALESGTPPGTAPSISNGTIINLPADNAVRVWSLVHDANGAGLEAGDTYELSLNAV